ncbi:type II toxin-antitoxin system PemK/MazF family toxin [Candidatus Woesearchaeota archaeon]|nr:type II toxin-antitoxin system PemK/MazF family toxin [Candidatus Woesearchaeota archaeon]
MEEFVRGDIVVIPFPFSDLSKSKRRPAVVVASLHGDDVILCQITKSRKNLYSIPLTKSDFKTGKLDFESSIRPNRLFTADKSIIIYKVGILKQSKIKEIQERIKQIIIG